VCVRREKDRRREPAALLLDPKQVGPPRQVKACERVTQAVGREATISL